MNVKRIEAVWKHIQAHPDEHNQGEWARMSSCGTTMCFAGHAVEMFGSGIKWEGVDEDEQTAYRTKARRPIAREAADLLDLDDAEAERLFYAPNFDLDDAVESMIGGW